MTNCTAFTVALNQRRIRRAARGLNDLWQSDKVRFRIERCINSCRIGALVRRLEAIVMEQAGRDTLTIEMQDEIAQPQCPFAAILSSHRLRRSLERIEQHRSH